ncbi:MAG: hypothetical protein K2W82_12710 [Candidatus Obscuribacterales bacterium]|nr:hypothetical protein [Candidatus Obscuribacterales bacterium]
MKFSKSKFLKFFKIILLIGIVGFSIEVVVFYVRDRFALAFQNYAQTRKDRVEIVEEGSDCTSRTTIKRIYLPVGSNYVSLGSVSKFDQNEFVSYGPVQTFSRVALLKLIESINKSKNSKIDYASLNLTDERVKRSWLTENATSDYDFSYFGLVNKYKLQVDLSDLPKALKMAAPMERFTSRHYSVGVFQPFSTYISCGDKLPWSINVGGKWWTTYDRSVSLALAELLFPNKQPLSDVELFCYPPDAKVDEKGVWSNLQKFTAQKNAAKILLAAKPLPSNTVLYVADVGLPRYAFEAKLKPLKHDSTIDEVFCATPLDDINPDWNVAIKAYGRCESIVEDILWLKQWKSEKCSPDLRLDMRIVKYGLIYTENGPKSWQQIGLDSLPDCRLSLLYNNKERGYLLTSKNGKQVYCCVEFSSMEDKKRRKLHQKLYTTETFLLSKQDALPKELASIFE